MNEKTETLGTPNASSADHQGHAQSKQAFTAEQASVGHQRTAPFVRAAPVSASILDLHPLEMYAGIVQHQGAPVHLILLPADVQVTSLKVAEEFIASISGELPTYSELQHLRNRMHHRFKPCLYYTCDQEPYDGDMATVIFDMATDDDRKWMIGPRSIRARAVRRVPAEAGIASAGVLSAVRVAEIANKLIDQESLAEDREPTNDEYLAAAGIKVGIGKMALAVQAELTLFGSHQGGDNA